MFYLFNTRCMTASALNWKGLVGNRYVLYAIGVLLVIQMSFTYQTHLQTLFGTRGIDISIWIRIITVSASVRLLVEIEKMIMRNFVERRDRA
ncbi:MAG: cation transporting ATPase C-terminal domain-containing protein [Candidatus Thiodiazotropha sp.]